MSVVTPSMIRSSKAALMEPDSLVGAGVQIVQTAGLALATDLTAPGSNPRVVGSCT